MVRPVAIHGDGAHVAGGALRERPPAAAGAGHGTCVGGCSPAAILASGLEPPGGPGSSAAGILASGLEPPGGPGSSAAGILAFGLEPPGGPGSLPAGILAFGLSALAAAG